jgi:Tannase and feruloyl esterase
VGRTRPLCPYPQVARYVGTGSIDQAENFKCTQPPTASNQGCAHSVGGGSLAVLVAPNDHARLPASPRSFSGVGLVC